MIRFNFKKRYVFIAVLAIAAILIACTDFTQNWIPDNENTGSNKIVIRLSVSDDDIRVAYPDVSSLEFTKFEFSGTETGSSTPSVSWQTTGTANAMEQLRNASISVTKGVEYKFTLIATAQNGIRYADTTSPMTINSAGTTLRFNLSLTYIGDTGSQGSASASLIMPSNDINKIKVSVYRVYDNGNNPTVLPDFNAREVTPTNGRLSLDFGNLEVGSYYAKFELYQNTTLKNTWIEYFVIAAGVPTKIEITRTESDKKELGIVTDKSNDPSFHLTYVTQYTDFVFTVATDITDPEIDWYIDGVEVSNVHGLVLSVSSYSLSAGIHEVEAKTSTQSANYTAKAEVDVLGENEFFLDFNLDVSADSNGVTRDVAQ